ncbi:MAG TPA: MBL fold metallo-hydrolase [Tepidisphaeraceae bacterium]|jgi:ribonuclease Z|nr:MBL fold metallo-hydrolase [Tepidisphaeraceae bacterium]
MSEQLPEKSFLVQKFARLGFGQFHIVGYSVAGEETVVQVPEMNVCFDIGRAPYFALTSDFVCITHCHMDHLAGLGYYLSQRHFQGMKPGTVLLPRELERPVDALLKCWRDVERQGTPYKLVPMSPGQMYEVRRDFGIRCFATHHGGPSLGYSLVSIREKLKPELLGTPGPQLVEMRKSGVEIQYRIEVPMIAFLGDTTLGNIFDQPDVQNAQVLITETTFFDADHRAKAKAGRHLHLEHLLEVLPKLKNEYIVLSHVSRRTGVRRAKHLLRKRIGEEQMKRIHFLMDFDHSREAGEVEDLVPPPAENAG